MPNRYELNRRKILARFLIITSAPALLAPRGWGSPPDIAPPGAADPVVPNFSGGVDVVNVFVTVRDRKGAVITSLDKPDFALTEDGRAQNIRYFARQSDLPLTLGLIVDCTPSESNMLATERAASMAFFRDVLRPDRDRAFLIQFGNGVELLQDLTSSRAKLESALGRLEPSESDRPGRGSGGGGGGNTLLSDAIYLASNEVLEKQKGRKAIVILGDGDHIGSREEQAIAAAQRADTLVFAIRIYDKDWGNGGRSRWRGLTLPGGLGGLGMPGGGGPGGPGGPGGGRPGGGGGPERSDGKRHLGEIAERTGGAYFEVTKKTPLDEIYRKIEEDLRNQYSLGYTPSVTDAADAYHKISVSVPNGDYRVQCRDGYYGVRP